MNRAAWMMVVLSGCAVEGLRPDAGSSMARDAEPPPDAGSLVDARTFLPESREGGLTASAAEFSSPDGRLSLFFPPAMGRGSAKVRLGRVLTSPGDRSERWSIDYDGPPVVAVGVLRGLERAEALDTELEVDARAVELVSTAPDATLRFLIRPPGTLLARRAPCRTPVDGTNPCALPGLQCVVELDEPSHRGCAVPCTRDAECPSPLACQRGRCRALACSGPLECERPGTSCVGAFGVGVCATESSTQPLTRARLCAAGRPWGEPLPAEGCGCSAQDPRCPVDAWRALADLDKRNPPPSTPATWHFGWRASNDNQNFRAFLGLWGLAAGARDPGFVAWSNGSDAPLVGARRGGKIQQVGRLSFAPDMLALKSYADIPGEPVQAAVLRFDVPRTGRYDLWRRAPAIPPSGRRWEADFTVRSPDGALLARHRLSPPGGSDGAPELYPGLLLRAGQLVELAPRDQASDAFVGEQSFDLVITDAER